MSIAFNDVCNLLESVELLCTRSPRLPADKEKSCVQQVIINWFSNHRKALDNPSTRGAAVLSILLPHRRKDRVYGLQEAGLSRKIVKVLGFSRGQLALFNAKEIETRCDLGARTEKAIKSWDGTFKKKHDVFIGDIDHLLVQLAARYRFSDPAIRRQRNDHIQLDVLLKDVLVKLVSFEVKWLIRLILRNHCTIDFDEHFLLKQYHFLLPDLLMFQNDYDAAFDMLHGDLSCYPPKPPLALEKSMRIDASKQLRATVGVKVGRPTFHKAWSFKHCLQLVGDRIWAAEVKYDGEYCEIHVDLENPLEKFQIFSKNGKDATADRRALQHTLQSALRMGTDDCRFTGNCVVLGELVVWCDRKQMILPFSKIRKHVSRSGAFIGTLQDSLPHEWEHLMVVFFDVLVLDDKPILRKSLQERRRVLKDLVQYIPGRAMRSKWTLLNFKDAHGITDLKQVFARSLAERQEGLVLKPLGAPYFSLLSEVDRWQPSYFIKMKKDYLADMGGERDLGDFAIIGASFDAHTAAKSNYKPLHWTHFYIGCVTNKKSVERAQARPKFKIVGAISLDKCIPKPELRYLNMHGRLREIALDPGGSINDFDIEHSRGCQSSMAVAFRQPFVAEILGGGYEQVQNERFEMLRHPRIKKIHHDRSWRDTVSMQELERMAKEKWVAPETDKLDGHARDVALLCRKYTKELYGSDDIASQYDTSQDTQRTTQRSSEISPKAMHDDTVIEETQQTSTQDTTTTSCTTPCPGSTQGKGIRASKQIRILVREDTPDRLEQPHSKVQLEGQGLVLPSLPRSSPDQAMSSEKRSCHHVPTVTPPPVKRRKTRTPLKNAGNNRTLAAFEYDSQEKVIHIYAEEGWKVAVHSSCDNNS